MKHRPRIVVIGSLVMDFVAKGARLPDKGETVLGESFGMFPGGKGANQAVQASRLGAEVFMVGSVGDDSFGDALVTSLKESHVDTRFVQKRAALKTAACCIHVDAEGNNSIVIVPEANIACTEDQVDAAAGVIESAHIVLCQLEIPITTVEYAFCLAARHEVRTILNPAPARPLSRALLSATSILTPNETEARALLPAASSEDLSESGVANALFALGPQAVIVTLGERGAYLLSEGTHCLVRAFPIDVKDATAAGDAFNGALAVGLSEGRDLLEAVTFANAAGALAATCDGAQPSLAWRKEVETFLDERRAASRHPTS
jgi:ribokinase